MFGAVPMVRVRVQVTTRDSAAATHAIARLGLLHLIDVSHGRCDTAPAGNAELLAAHRALRDRIRRVLDRLGATAPALARNPAEPSIADFDIERQRIASAFEPVEEAANRAWTTREEACGREASSERALLRAESMRRSGFDAEGLVGLRFVAAYVVSAAEDALTSLSDFLSPAPHRIEVLDTTPQGVLAVVMTAATSRARLEAAMRLVHVEAIDPAAVTSSVGVTGIQTALAAARRTAASAADELATLVREHAESLNALLARAETCVLLLQAQEQFGSAGRFVVISGWIPADNTEGLKKAVIQAAPSAIVDVDPPVIGLEGDAGLANIPILHRNPLLLRPFQPLVDLYDTPSYRELQPTGFFAVSFLLMFGLMFGDVGHGAVLAAAGYCLFRYMPRFLDYGILLMEAGVASIAFGFLYGSLFGVEGVLPVLWLAPMRDLPSFMRIAVGFGVVLVSGGLILNVVNSWRLHDNSAALFSIHGLFGAFLYWAAVALVARLAMPASMVARPWMIGVLACGAGALLLLRVPIVRTFERGARPRPTAPQPPVWLRALEGSVELVDTLFGYFANTISFVRIAAFAAVHAGVCIAIFAVSDMLAQTRFGGPLAIVALVVGNGVLILLEGLTVTVQVLRLEYYEFFGKFFRGGGKAYRPLMLKPVQSKEGAL